MELSPFIRKIIATAASGNYLRLILFSLLFPTNVQQIHSHESQQLETHQIFQLRAQETPGLSLSTYSVLVSSLDSPVIHTLTHTTGTNFSRDFFLAWLAAEQPFGTYLLMSTVLTF